MSDDRLPKQLLYGELCYGKRSLGGQKKRFKDTLKKTLISFNIDVTKWEVCARDRPLWRSMIHTGARTAETNRIAEAQKKRAARKARLLSTTSTSAGPTYPCPECGRVLQARIGLISHLRTHRVNHHRRSYGHHRKRWTNNALYRTVYYFYTFTYYHFMFKTVL